MSLPHPRSTLFPYTTLFRSHLHIVEFGPAARIDRIGGAQIDQRLLEALRSHVAPPVHVTGMPAFQRLEYLAILTEIHVVRNLGRIVDVQNVDVHGGTPLQAFFVDDRSAPA